MPYFLQHSVCLRYYFLFFHLTGCKLSFDPLNNLLILYCWILYSHRDNLAAFASILCFNSSITVVKPFLFTSYFSSISLAFPYLRVPICPLFALSRMLISFLSCFISSSILPFHHGSFFFPHSYFLRPN